MRPERPGPGLRLLAAGGGTGGHVAPGRNLAERLGEGAVHFLIAGRPVEEAFFHRAPWPRTVLFPGGGRRPGPLAPFPWVAAWHRARRVRKSFRPHALLLLGGYTSLPSLVAALGTGIPCYAFEPNALPGKALRLAAPFCRRIFCHFPSTARRLGSRAVVTGSPLPRGFGRREPRQRPKLRRSMNLDPGLTTLLVAGGSQGARALNDLLVSALPVLARRFSGRLQVLHVSGERDYERVRAAWQDTSCPGKVEPFLDPMEPAYAAADLVLCRGGAMTVAEVSAMGLPAVIVPYPHHKDRHQYENARELVEGGGALLMEEHGLNPGRLCDLLEGLVAEPRQLEAMARASKERARPEGAEKILEILGRDLERTLEKGKGSW